MSNRALTLNRFGGADALSLGTTAMPEASPGIVLVRVSAAGINGLDWKIREGYLRDAMPTPFPTVLGLELSGVVEAVAAGSRFAIGDRVFGLAAPGKGAYAEHVAVPEMLLAPIPSTLDDITAAALPVTGLTAAQMLVAGAAKAGDTILVHGASGGVGSILVQLAKQLGVHVIATASAANRDYVAALGADRVIDRQAERFEELVSDVDLVIDLVGADLPDRSWPVLRQGGVLVSIARFDIGAPRTDGRRGIPLRMKPDAGKLAELAVAVAAGDLKVTIAETVSPDELPAAIERNRTGHAPGKAVVRFAQS